ncbi:MAG: hypothetical protein AB1861_22685, partial [Cyanobacteriota bacterium]
LNNGKRLAMTKHPQLRSRVKGNLSSTVLKTSGRGDKPAEFNPCRYVPRNKFVNGFQTGDIVKAVVTKGKKLGTYVGRVAVRSTGSFNISGKTGLIQGIGHQYCRIIYKKDGYNYGY